MSPWMKDSHSRGSRCLCGGSAPGQHLTCPASRDRGPRSQRRGRRGRGQSASAASRGRVSAPPWLLIPSHEPRDCGPPGECWPWPRNHSIAQLIIKIEISWSKWITQKLTQSSEVLAYGLCDGGGVRVVDVLQLAPVTREHIILPDTEVVVSKSWQ